MEEEEEEEEERGDLRRGERGRWVFLVGFEVEGEAREGGEREVGGGEEMPVGAREEMKL